MDRQTRAPGQESGPTVVVFVRGGVVQGVESEQAVRVVVCDFDVDDAGSVVAGRPCHIGSWNPPDRPSAEFAEVVAVLTARQSG